MKSANNNNDIVIFQEFSRREKLIETSACNDKHNFMYKFIITNIPINHCYIKSTIIENAAAEKPKIAWRDIVNHHGLR